jgi:hypothetical protein
MATRDLTGRDDRLKDVLADVERNQRLVEESRRRRVIAEHRLRESRETLRRHRRRGFFSFFRR